MFGQGSVWQDRGDRFIPDVRLDPRQEVEHRCHQPPGPRQQESRPECNVEDGLCYQRGTPGGSVVNTSDEDLSRCEFQQIVPRAASIGRNQTLRHEDDSFARAKSGVRDGIVVAERAIPRLENPDPIENLTSQRHRTAPRKVSSVFPQCGNDRSIPYRSKEAGHAAAFRSVPAITGRDGNVFTIERCDEPTDPLNGKTRVGVAEDEDFGVTCTVLYAVNQVVYFLPSASRRARGENRRVHLRQESRCRVFGRIDNEDDPKAGVVLVENGANVFAKARLHPSAGTEHDNTWEPIGLGAIRSDVINGENALNKRHEALEDCEATDQIDEEH